MTAIHICVKPTVRLAVRFVLGALLLGFVLPGSSYAEPPQVLDDEQAEELIAEGDRFADQSDYLEAVKKYTKAYLGIVSRLRGQSYLEDVEPTLMTRSELSEEMKHQVEIDYTAEELALMDGTFKSFGLVPDDLDVRSTIIKLFTEEVAGFYDPRTKAMVLIREDADKKPGLIGRFFGQRPAFDKEEQKVTLAHELTHALQDQLYGLKEMQERVENDDDMSMAFSALVEGDATLIMFGEMGRQEGNARQMMEMTPEAAATMFSFMKMMMPIAGGKTYRSSPPIFREGLIFPYAQGIVFNLSMTHQNGLTALHTAYDNPPVSTEQILHPDKYLKDVDLPWEIKINNAKDLLPETWKHLGGNCLGEFQTGILFKGVSGATRAAEGWDGDRYEIYQSAEGKFGLVWLTAWDSLEDAKQFQDVYQAYMKKRTAPKLKVKLIEGDVEASDEKKTEDVAESSIPMTIYQIENSPHFAVAIVQGMPRSLHTGIYEKLKGSDFSEKRFPGKKSK